MSRYSGNNEACEGCGMLYKDFRCSIETFAEAKAALYRAGETDPAKWRQKRKNSVLGYWHEVKMAEWLCHVAECTEGGIVETDIIGVYHHIKAVLGEDY